MLLFYKYQKAGIKKAYRKAQRTINYMETYAKWYYTVKFLQKQPHNIPYIHGWGWRSLYLERTHIKNKEIVVKAVLLHLFWVMDIWRLKHPMYLKAVIGFPIMISTNISYKTPLVLYSTIHRWKFKYGLKKHKFLPYIISPVWDNYMSEQWMSRSYFTFMRWRKKKERYFKKFRKTGLYQALNFWFLTNRYFHNIQGRLYCKTFNEPFRYTKVLWLRLFQYPSVYDYRWFPFVKHLACYKLNETLPWDLVYTSKRTWTFDPTARILERLFHYLIKYKTTITEYSLIKQWRNLLTKKDRLSRLVQVKIRNTPLFLKYRRQHKETL